MATLYSDTYKTTPDEAEELFSYFEEYWGTAFVFKVLPEFLAGLKMGTCEAYLRGYDLNEKLILKHWVVHMPIDEMPPETARQALAHVYLQHRDSRGRNAYLVLETYGYIDFHFFVDMQTLEGCPENLDELPNRWVHQIQEMLASSFDVRNLPDLR